MAPAISQILRRIQPGISIRHLKIGDIKDKKPLLSQIGPSELVLIGGGGLYGKWHSLEKMAELAEGSSPVVLYALGLSINDGDSTLPKETIDWISQLNRIAALSSVRDGPTHHFLQKLGCPSEVIGDPVAFYDAPGSSSISRTRIRRIGINLPCHGFTNQEDLLSKAIPAVRNTCNSLLRNGYEVHYLLHYPDERSLLDKLRFPFSAIHDCGAEALANVYRSLHLVIGGMLHSNIFAFAAEVPFLSLAYDQKHRGFADLIDYSTYMLPLEGVTSGELDARVQALLANHSEIKRHLTESRKRLWTVHKSFAEKVLRLALASRS